MLLHQHAATAWWRQLCVAWLLQSFSIRVAVYSYYSLNGTIIGSAQCCLHWSPVLKQTSVQHAVLHNVALHTASRGTAGYSTLDALTHML
jgi:hypothetical protein